MNGDSYAWVRRAVGDGTTTGGLLSPEFRLSIGGFELGPLLSRSMHGGIFALREGGKIVESQAIQLSPLGPHDPGDAALREFSRHSLSQIRPGVTRVYASGVDRGVRWVHVERVSGWSLRTLLGRRELAFTGRRLAMLGAELADALAPLHASGAAFGLVHGRLGTGHVLVDRSGRLRLCGVPVARSLSAMPDAIGIGAIVACAALGVCPDPRGVTLATARALAAALDRPENVARSPLGLRRLVQSLLLLQPNGFLPAMSVVREQFLMFAEGLPLGVPDPMWGRALCEAVRGLSPTVRPSPADVEAVVEALAGQVPELFVFLPVLFAPSDVAGCEATSAPEPLTLAALTGAMGAAFANNSKEPEPALAPDAPEADEAPATPPPAFEMPILPSLHDVTETPKVRSLRERIFPLLVG